MNNQFIVQQKYFISFILQELKKQLENIIEQKAFDYLIRVDRKKCINAGQCVIAVPELFILNDEQ